MLWWMSVVDVVDFLLFTTDLLFKIVWLRAQLRGKLSVAWLLLLCCSGYLRCSITWALGSQSASQSKSDLLKQKRKGERKWQLIIKWNLLKDVFWVINVGWRNSKAIFSFYLLCACRFGYANYRLTYVRRWFTEQSYRSIPVRSFLTINCIGCPWKRISLHLAELLV